MVSRLFRPRTDRMIAGVCGGLGLYFGVDPVIVRLLFVVLAVTTGLTLVLYPVLWLVMPDGGPARMLPPGARFDPQTGEPLSQDPVSTGRTVRLAQTGSAAPIGNRNRILALVLVSVGAMILLDRVGELFGVDIRGMIVPVLLVGLGLYLLRGNRT